jgi:hypothetical protein
MVQLQDIQTPNDILAYVRYRDYENHLTEIDDPIAAFAFLLGNYDFGRDMSITAEQVAAYKEMLERVFLPSEFGFSEGDGGLSFYSIEDLFSSLVSFHCSERLDYEGDLSDVEQMQEAVNAVYPNLITNELIADWICQHLY